jgi:hypothetical protein
MTDTVSSINGSLLMVEFQAAQLLAKLTQRRPVSLARSQLSTARSSA